MRWFAHVLLAGVASATLRLRSTKPSLSEQLVASRSTFGQSKPVARQASPRFLTPETQRRFNTGTIENGADVSIGFAVNGSAIPEVTWDVGESYAGSLPISEDANDTNTLFFWFFPSENQTVGKEITIWLSGGVIYCPVSYLYYE